MRGGGWKLPAAFSCGFVGLPALALPLAPSGQPVGLSVRKCHFFVKELYTTPQIV